jgi:hypothetical protein
VLIRIMQFGKTSEHKCISFVLRTQRRAFLKTMCGDSCEEFETKVPGRLESELTQLINLHNILL